MTEVQQHIKHMRRLNSSHQARGLLTRMQAQLDMIRALVPWPLLHDVLQRDLDECRRIAKEKGFIT